MRHKTRILTAAVGIAALTICLAALAIQAPAQPPGDKPKDDLAKDKKDYSNSSIVTQMMAFDKNKDGKLTRDEITDPRLLRLFEQADTNKDGVVTKEELMALAAKMEAEVAQGGGRGGPGGPGGFGGPGGPGGFGGPGGPGGFGGPPQPGQVMPTFLQDRLNLTAEQKKQLEELQKDVETRLAKILTDEQKKQLKEMQERGPGGFGPPGGRGGDGGRGRRGGDKPPE
jgi:Spy/CpxP family protein refolding chaperone